MFALTRATILASLTFKAILKCSTIFNKSGFRPIWRRERDFALWVSICASLSKNYIQMSLDMLKKSVVSLQ